MWVGTTNDESRDVEKWVKKIRWGKYDKNKWGEEENRYDGWVILYGLKYSTTQNFTWKWESTSYLAN